MPEQLSKDVLELPAGRELDVLVAEKVMGISLVPPREAAMAHVAAGHIGCTGPVFELRDGRKFRVPPGERLKQPEGCKDWNARYMLYVAQQVGDEWEGEIAAVRDLPKPYSTDIAAAWEIPNIRQVRAPGKYTTHGHHATLWHAYCGAPDEYGEDIWQAAYAETAPLAICRAALKAIAP